MMKWILILLLTPPTSFGRSAKNPEVLAAACSYSLKNDKFPFACFAKAAEVKLVLRKMGLNDIDLEQRCFIKANDLSMLQGFEDSDLVDLPKLCRDKVVLALKVLEYKKFDL